MIITNVEEELLKNGKTMTQTWGVSMEPMLHARKSSVVLIKPQGELKKNDVVLFKRDDELVLHRIVNIKNGIYKIRGDNCISWDMVSKDKIIGVMTGYFPDESEKFISCDDLEYKKYVKTVYFRYLPKRFRYYIGRILELISGNNRKA